MSRSTRWPSVALAALALWGLARTPLNAQTIGINLSDSARITVAPSAKVTVPILVDLTSASGGLNIASLQADLAWASTRLTFDSLRVVGASGFSLTPNLTNAATGSISFNGFSASALAASGGLANAYFTASATTGGTRMSLNATAAGNELGASILAQLRVRALDVCVAPSGLWGDVNADNLVNIIDAQQIARSSVGLSTANPTAVAERGDVTADGSVNILDAQQIARASVGLTAAARVGTALFTPPTVASVTMTPSGAQSVAVGATFALSATARDAGNAELTGCSTVTWSSSNPAAATVSSSGLVTGVADGIATITATSGGQTASAVVTVGTGSGISTGLRLNVTSPAPTDRFFVVVDSGGLAEPIIQRFTVSGATSGTLDLAVPVGTNYRVRAFAAHPLSSNLDTSPTVIAGFHGTGIAVVNGSLTAVTAAMTSTAVDITSAATTARSATPIPVNFTVTDPTRFLNWRGFSTCGHLVWAPTAFTSDVPASGASEASRCFGSESPSGVWNFVGVTLPGLAAPGTIHYQALVRVNVANSTTSFNAIFVGPSIARAQALRTVAVSGTANTITVNVTSSARTAKRYIVVATSDSLPAPISATLEGTAMASGTVSLAVPTTGTYNLRVISLDNAVGYNLVAGGARATVVIPIGQTTATSNVTLTMAALGPGVPTQALVGSSLPITFTIAEPSGLLSNVFGNGYCGNMRYGTTAFTADLSGGTNVNACTVSGFGTDSVRYSGVTIPSQPTPVTMHVMFQGTAEIMVNGASVFVYWVLPSPTRAEAARTIEFKQVSTVTVTPATPGIAIGATQQMTATARDAANNVITGFPITWVSSASSIASINPSGIVTGVANGTTTISAFIGGVSGSTTVTVSGGITVGSVAVTLPQSSVTGNATQSAASVVRDPSNNIISAALTWTSSNPQVARVAANGTVQALGQGTTTISATAGGVTGSANLTVGSTPGNFSITLRNLSTLSGPVQTAFNNAAARWAQVLRGDLTDFVASGLDVAFCGNQTAGTTLNETVDDLLIYVKVDPIDGVGGTLGSAGPCYTRSGGLPFLGQMLFDSADLDDMVANGTLEAVILHEMGHVLGVGTMWSSFGLLADPSPTSDGTCSTFDPIFTGANAQWAFATLGTGHTGRAAPVENCYGGGTRNAHWRESVLVRELMTGFVSNAGNPMSPLTVTSMLDLGYVVDNSAADTAPWFRIAGEVRTELKELPMPPAIEVDPQGRPIRRVQLRPRQ